MMTNPQAESTGSPVTISNQGIAEKNAADLRAFVDRAIAGQVKVPIYHGHINKQEVCKLLNITYSTRNSNPKLKDEFKRLVENFDRLDVYTDSGELPAKDKERELNRLVRNKEDRIAVLEGVVADLRHQLKQRDMEMEHMIHHGRRLDPYTRPNVDDTTDAGSQNDGV